MRERGAGATHYKSGSQQLLPEVLDFELSSCMDNDYDGFGCFSRASIVSSTLAADHCIE